MQQTTIDITTDMRLLAKKMEGITLVSIHYINKKSIVKSDILEELDESASFKTDIGIFHFNTVIEETISRLGLTGRFSSEDDILSIHKNILIVNEKICKTEIIEATNLNRFYYIKYVIGIRIYLESGKQLLLLNIEIDDINAEEIDFTIDGLALVYDESFLDKYKLWDKILHTKDIWGEFPC